MAQPNFLIVLSTFIPTNIPEGTTRKKLLRSYNEVANQALCDALKNNGRKIKKIRALSLKPPSG